MLNQCVIVGRVLEKPTSTKINDKEVAILKLSVTRNYKNENGDYDTDVIEVNLTDKLLKAEEYLNIGDLVGIKGRLETENGILIIKCEKATFLTSKKQEED